MRRWQLCSRLFALALVSVLVLAPCLPAFAQDAEETEGASTPPEANPGGLYPVTGTTNTGKKVSTNVLVTDLPGDRIQFQARVMGFPVTTSGKAAWNADRTQVTVPVAVYIIGLVDASGQITLSATESGWEFSGSGSGSVPGASGSATAAGFKPGGVPAPSAAEVSEASGVSEQVRSADDGLSALQPSGGAGDLDTDAAVTSAAALLFALFLLIIWEAILGTPLF